MTVAPAQSETRLTVVKVRTCLAFEARTFDGLHVAAITPVKKSFFHNLSNAFQVMLDMYSIKVLLHGRNNENVLHKKEIFSRLCGPLMILPGDEEWHGVWFPGFYIFVLSICFYLFSSTK